MDTVLIFTVLSKSEQERAQANNFKEKGWNTHFWGTENGERKGEN